MVGRLESLPHNPDQNYVGQTFQSARHNRPRATGRPESLPHNPDQNYVGQTFQSARHNRPRATGRPESLPHNLSGGNHVERHG
jgi:hypothetical protein